MAATRTQIYLTADQRRRLDELRRRDGRPLAAVVREAVDAYLDSSAPDAAAAIERARGALPKLKAPDRREWDRGYG